MEGVLGIVLLVVVATVIYGIQRALGRGASAISGAVTGNTRRRGLAATRLRTEFTAPVPGGVIIDRVQETLQLGQPSAQKLRLDGISDDGRAMTIVQANKLYTQLEFVIQTEPTASGCTGLATATRWLESDGQIVSTENIERIHKHVQAAVEQAGGTYEIVEGEG